MGTNEDEVFVVARAEAWVPALRAAGLEHRTPYAMRHTFASNAIAAGIATFEIARVMGTSVVQIEKTYGHLLPDAIDRARVALDTWEARVAAATKPTTVTQFDPV